MGWGNAGYVGDDGWYKNKASGGGGSLALDGNVGTGANGNFTSPVVVSLTTTNSNVVVIVAVTYNGTTGITVTPTSPNLTFTHRATANRFGGRFAQTFYAIASSPLTSESISVAFTGGTASQGMVTAFGVSGANTASPFDPNGALPGIVGTGGAGGAYPTATTSNANTFIFGVLAFDSTSTPTAGSGWTLLQNPTNSLSMSEYQIVSSTQSALAATSTNGTAGDTDAAIADAITQ